jgi:hypothetical protein
VEKAISPTQAWDSRALIASGSTAAVLSLGLLYATGAIWEATRLHGAHVQVRDTLPLIPLPNLLAIGIGVVVSTLALVTLSFSGVAFVGWCFWRAPERQPVTPRTMTSIWVVVAASALIFVLANPPFAAAQVELLLVGSIWGVRARYTGGLRAMLVIFAATYLASIGVSLLKAYTYPDPLPRVRLFSGNGAVTGRLIVHTDGIWYVVPSRQRVTALPDVRVQKTEVVLVKLGRHHRSVGRLLLDVIT